MKINRLTLYPMIGLTRDRVQRQFTVHSLVAAAFIGPRPEGHEIHHRDRDKSNAMVGNLEYLTQADHDALTFAARPRGSRHYLAKLTEAQALEIWSLRAIEEQRTTAKRFGLSQRNVMLIQTGRAWKHATPGASPATPAGRLAPDEVRRIRALEGSVSATALAAEYGVTRENIRMIQRRLTWKHLD
jgi:hypothetical protein